MVAERRVCSLCGQPSFRPVSGEDGAVYCCRACLEVAALLAEPAPKAEAATADAELTYGVRGLWCSSCAWLVEERLRRKPGITAVRVSFLERSARIVYDSSRIAPEAIQRVIRGLGYRAGPDVEPEDGESFFTRLLVGGLLAMHIMATSLIIYGRDWMGLSGPESAWLEHIFYLMQFVVSLPLAAILGLPILRAGLNGLLRGLPNVQTLVSIGAMAALALSIRNLFTGAGHVYFDTAAMLFFLLTVGRWLEMRAHESGRTSFESLVEGLPDRVRRVAADELEEIALADLQPGARIRLAAGDVIPVDGKIASGRAEVDERMLTGEPAPALRVPGDEVCAGTINLDGVLDVIVTSVGETTRAGRIRGLLEDWVWQRSPAEKLADRLAAWMVYGAIAIAGLTFAGYAVSAGWESALLNSLSVLLIACPCALGIATPLTLRQAFNLAAEHGVLLRRPALLEVLPDLRRIYFDKTGTLTRNRHEVEHWICAGDLERNTVRYAAALEQDARHPLASAITAYAEQMDLDIPPAEDVRTVPGKGVSGMVGGVRVRVGSRLFMVENDLHPANSTLAQYMQTRASGGTAVYVGWEGRVRGVAVVGEQMRPGLRIVLTELKALDFEPVVLTGDSVEAAARWREQLGIPVRGGLSPEDKLDILAQPGPGAIMVGDGINDGPALGAAAVGIALRGGTDIARSAAEITLVDDDLSAIPWLIRLGNETKRRLRQNLAWAVGYNLIGIGLAVSGLLQPVLAALAMVLSSALVTRNALRLRKIDGWKTAAGESTESQSNFPEIFAADTQRRSATFD